MNKLLYNLLVLKDDKIFLNTYKKTIEDLIIILIQRFHTLKEIAKFFHTSERSLRSWRRKGQISLFAIQKLRSLNYASENLVQIISCLKYISVSASPHKVKIPTLNENLAYVVGYISGDGHLKDPAKHKQKWEIIIESWKDDPKELRNMKKIIADEFGIYTSLCKNKKRKGYRLFINCKVIHKIFTDVFKIPTGRKSESVRVPSIIKNAPKNIKNIYIKGWFDAEASVTFSHQRPQVEFYIKNKSVTNWIYNQLKQQKINVRRKRRGTLLICSKEAISQFSSIIGFRRNLLSAR